MLKIRRENQEWRRNAKNLRRLCRGLQRESGYNDYWGWWRIIACTSLGIQVKH